MAPPEKLVDVNVGGTNFSVKAQYRGLKVIGRGSYGIVASCVDSASGDKVAIKRIKPMSAHASDAKHVLREVRCMRLLGAHNNVVAVRDLFVNTREDELYIVMELMDSDLHRIIQSPQALTDAHHRFFMYQLVRGVAYMHAHGVIHRDLKPGNLLVTRACELRITDFGLARLQSVAADGGGDLDAGPMTQHVVTRWYRPPELMLTPDGRYTNAVDMWSVRRGALTPATLEPATRDGTRTFCTMMPSRHVNHVPRSAASSPSCWAGGRYIRARILCTSCSSSSRASARLLTQR